MTKKTHVKIDDAIEVRYASWIKMMIDLIAPKNLFLVAGRATAKTTDIIAERSMRICEDMPGAYFAFVTDTYVNALKNIVPALIEGWKRKGWKEGVDFVTDEPPPAHFKQPYKQPQTYKNTISTRHGCFFVLVSMDSPTSAAGNSYQHLFGDETKYLDFAKIKKLMPALRGYPAFGHSIYYRGNTFTTDMPNVSEGDYDWIMDREKDMNKKQMKDALSMAITLNKVKKEFYNAFRDKQFKKCRLLQKQITKWMIRWVRVRKNSTLFYIVSSFANVDILKPGYFSDSLEALGIEEFKSSIISLKPTLKKGLKFYITLGDHHFYDDGILKEYYENKYKIGDTITPSSLALRYIDHNRELDAGVDFGDMLSMVTGQELGNFVYMLKNFFTIPPESTRELAAQFIEFYKYHKKKVLNLYYDRSGNQYSKIRKDWATELQREIEVQNGAKTGWKVILMNKNQATILQEEEYTLMKSFFGGYDKDLPQIKIDKFSCREYKSSLELSKTKIRKNLKTGSNSIHKDKSSEKLPPEKLPMYSTNFSDAGKYFFFRPKWVIIIRKRGPGKMGAPSEM
ncbi:hypothetical protein [Flavicella sp.]|uniref:hypothetical protein n=1 Tax=Flavicella sp. TaxID=2957742 RepID=UPI0030183426